MSTNHEQTYLISENTARAARTALYRQYQVVCEYQQKDPSSGLAGVIATVQAALTELDLAVPVSPPLTPTNEQKPPIEQQFEAYMAHYTSSLNELAQGRFCRLYVNSFMENGSMKVEFWAGVQPDDNAANIIMSGVHAHPVEVLKTLRRKIAERNGKEAA